ncbi:hypothetical protein BGZ70_004095 [Mortierella alpina]|uniref:Little elongation complex subunit 2 C-terminal domain-containing protein n=1 Tax=Mortierella alpina TaxID=64518 RepID=A0A9P6LVP2_MORAP|nr:hypothetical protein BGZ70_004095 [Mortierella alpina]
MQVQLQVGVGVEVEVGVVAGVPPGRGRGKSQGVERAASAGGAQSSAETKTTTTTGDQNQEQGSDLDTSDSNLETKADAESSSDVDSDMDPDNQQGLAADDNSDADDNSEEMQDHPQEIAPILAAEHTVTETYVDEGEQAARSIDSQHTLPFITTVEKSRPSGVLNMELYNTTSFGGRERVLEFFLHKRRLLDGDHTPEPEPSPAINDAEALPADDAGDADEAELESNAEEAGPEPDAQEDVAEQPKAKKRKVSLPISSPPLRATESSNDTSASQDSFALVQNDLTTPATPAATLPASRFDIGDLVASVASYTPEFASALQSAQIKPVKNDGGGKETTEQQQQQHHPQQKLLQPSQDVAHYYHPCILSHEHRSALTREEHRRYIMYQGILQNQHRDKQLPPLGPEDKALWTLLQEKVEQERALVRQWNARIYRSRISGFFNPAIASALEGKFQRARRRVEEEYPRPIWPTDENGVPLEKAIEVDDRYWKCSEPSSSAAAPTTPKHSKHGRKPNEHDFRRRYIPKKKAAPSVSLDPTVRQLSQEQNVHIALAASTLVALAKTLPSLASEWEIPVRVVLEDAGDGGKIKRIYVDKPLVPKRISELELTQAFYDGVLKRLAVVGSATTDVSVLSVRPTQAEAESSTLTTTSVEQGLGGGGEEGEGRGTDAPEEMSLGSMDTTESEVQASCNNVQDSTAAMDVDMGGQLSGSPGTALDLRTEEQQQDETIIHPKDEIESQDGTLDAADQQEAPFSETKSLEGDDAVNDSMEYSLWTFGTMRLLIRGRVHGYLNHTVPPRQVVLKSVLDYVPDIGLTELGRSAKAGWWMSTWIRDDRLVAVGRVDVSTNQFVRYEDPNALLQMGKIDPENPLGGIFSDLPGITIQDASTLKGKDREVQEWIKPHMRMIHYVLGKLLPLGPGQYILEHKRNDVSANVYKAVQEQSEASATAKAPSKTAHKEGRGVYDLHAAHRSSPQVLSAAHMEAGIGGGGSKPSVPDEELLLHWFGTPDQIPGTFPYAEESEPASSQQKHGGNKTRGRGGSSSVQKRGSARGRGGRGRGRGHQRGKHGAKAK